MAANRDRVLAAAAAAIRREGAGVPLATIAADAGVGVGTLYRRYPSAKHSSPRSFAGPSRWC